MNNNLPLSEYFTTSMKLPHRPKLEAEIYNEELHRRFVKWMERSEMSIRKVARMMGGKSYTSVGQYLNYRYEGNIKAFEYDVRRFLDRKERVRIPKERIFCKTPTSELIWEFLQSCHERHKIGGFIAPSGAGKTWTIREYKDKYPSTVLITANPTLRSFSAMLRTLAGKVGARSSNTALDDLMYRIIDKLSDSGKLVVIDEAHYLKFESFEIIRIIYDQAQTGFAYLGTPRLYSQMRGDNRFDWEQILSRITIRRSISEISYSDIRGIADTICPGLSKGALKFLYQVAQEPGRLRTAVDLLENAIEVAEAEEIRVSLQLLKDLKSLNDF